MKAGSTICRYLFLFFGTTGRLLAQDATFFQQADTVFTATEASIHVFGNVVISGNTSNFIHHGTIQTYEDVNPGDFTLQGGRVRATGDFIVYNDWINNGTLLIDSGKVEMYGDNQYFSGDSISRFYNLQLTGTGIKEQEQHIRVKNELDLTRRELAVQSYILYADNPEPSAILYDAMFGTEGIISTDEDGVIKKVVNQGMLNVIPTGSSRNTFRHRPVKAQLLSGSSDTVRVTFHHHSPTLLNAHAEDKDTSLCKIQEAYFYTVNSESSTSRYQLQFAAHLPTDGEYRHLAKWHNPTWKAVYDQTEAISDPNYTYIGIADAGDFVHEHFTLAHRTPIPPELNADTTECYVLSPVQVISPLNHPWYEWSVVNSTHTATVSSGQGTPDVWIDWGTSIGGTISVYYHDAMGCTSPETSLTIQDVSVSADFSYSPYPDNYYTGNYQFDNHSLDASSYEWDFGDETLLSTTSKEMFVHTFPSQGEGEAYHVMLIAANEMGCIDTALQVIHIPKLFVFHAPNSFTPDGDGINDFFFAESSDIEFIELRIFNRWGELIFEEAGTNATQVVWNGTYNGNPVQSGTYSYLFIVTPKANYYEGKREIAGTVNVLR